jgi:hypothetical protein
VGWWSLILEISPAKTMRVFGVVGWTVFYILQEKSAVPSKKTVLEKDDLLLLSCGEVCARSGNEVEHNNSHFIRRKPNFPLEKDQPMRHPAIYRSNSEESCMPRLYIHFSYMDLSATFEGHFLHKLWHTSLVFS